jgi:hypothetical protein
VRHYLDGLRGNTVAVTAIGGWSIYRWGWQFFSSEALDEAHVPSFGAFGAAWDEPWSPLERQPGAASDQDCRRTVREAQRTTARSHRRCSQRLS